MEHDLYLYTDERTTIWYTLGLRKLGRVWNQDLDLGHLSLIYICISTRSLSTLFSAWQRWAELGWAGLGWAGLVMGLDKLGLRYHLSSSTSYSHPMSFLFGYKETKRVARVTRALSAWESA